MVLGTVSGFTPYRDIGLVQAGYDRFDNFAMQLYYAYIIQTTQEQEDGFITVTSPASADGVLIERLYTGSEFSGTRKIFDQSFFTHSQFDRPIGICPL